MAFSIDNKGSFKPIKNNKISFKGVRPELDALNTPVERFVLPIKLNKDERAYVEYIQGMPNGKGGYDWDKDQVRSIKFPVGSDILNVPQEDFNKEAFAYRYKIVNKSGDVLKYRMVDQYRKVKIDDEDWNIVIRGENEGISSAGGSMYHALIDSAGKVGKDNKIEINKDFVRNHFNKLGGSMATLIYLLKKGEFAPYKYIISTPDIGADPISSHKYWPNNSYQCGNLEDFKTFNWELFKRGKGYVADGAFTSQGLQSPIVQHVLKWGEISPFYKMLKINGEPSLGILPDSDYELEEDKKTNAQESSAKDKNRDIKFNEHIGVRVVNNPNDKSKYDQNKPTYIQFYDERLSSKSQVDSDELITSYDMPNPEDHYDIVTNNDSVQPYYFEITSKTKDKLKVFEGKKSVLLKDIEDIQGFLSFPHFKITSKGKASGASYWDGNTDIIKMNLSNPYPGTEDGLIKAREYLYGVASYWTEMIQSDFLLQTAKSKEEERRSIAKENKISYDDIVNNISRIDIEKWSDTLKQNKTAKNYVEDFPIQSMETSPELSAIFAQDLFKQELFKDGFKDKITEFVNSVIDDAMPKSIKDEEREIYKTYAAKALSNTILRNLYAKSLNKDAVKKTGEIDLNELGKVNLISILSGLKVLTPKQERDEVVKYLRKGLKDALADETFKTNITNKFKDELKSVSLNDFKIADSLVLQTKGGLNWRFDAARDIGDLDAVRDGTTAFDLIWNGKDGVKEFWTKFIEHVKKYHSSAYIISEISSLWDFYSNENKDIQNHFDFLGKTPEELEKVFLTETGSTTSSNYANYFNNLAAFVGVDPEHGGNETGRAGNVTELRKKVEAFIQENQAGNIIYSHSFTDNHDKPTTLHTLPLNMNLFLFNDKTGGPEEWKKNSTLDNAPEEYKKIARDITGREDYAHISAKAVAVADAMTKAVDRTNLSQEEKDKLRAAIKCLANGQKDENAKPSLKRAHAYGYLPFEITIKDALKRAGIEDDDNDSKLFTIHYEMMKDPMKLQEGLWQMMNAIPGVPTLYNGAEYAQTGYETPSKNMYLGNRNPILHNMKNRENYGEHYKKMNAVSGLYQQTGMSALRNGYPISMRLTTHKPSYSFDVTNSGALDYIISQISQNGGLKAVRRFISEHASDINDENEYKKALHKAFKIEDPYGTNYPCFKELVNNKKIEEAVQRKAISMWPIYKYDDKGSKVISVVTNYNVPNGCASKDFEPITITEKVREIPIKYENDRCPLPDGTILRRKVYDSERGDYIDEKDKEYYIENGCIKSKYGQEIVVDDTVLNFYVPTKGQINAPRQAAFHQ